MRINVLLENGVFKYSVHPNPPLHRRFVHHFKTNDQITWVHQGQTVQVTFKNDICPFVHDDGSPWAGKTATFPGRAAKLNPDFVRDRYYSPVKYSVTLPDAPGAPEDDPEVIIVDA